MAFFICGFTGSGKTTLLRKLSADPSCKRAIDLDDYILENFAEPSERSLGDYIRRVGFDVFRDNEQLAIITLTQELEANDLVALGGGSLERAFNVERIKSYGHYLVWLNMDFELCLSRVRGDGNRPLLEKSEQELREIFEKRREVFKMANIQLCVNDVDAVQSIAALKTLVH